MTGLSRTACWRLERTGQFPRKRQLSAGAVGWLESEILAWMNEGRDGARRFGEVTRGGLTARFRTRGDIGAHVCWCITLRTIERADQLSVQRSLEIAPKPWWAGIRAASARCATTRAVGSQRETALEV